MNSLRPVAHADGDHRAARIRNAIAEAAVSIADAEGADAVSMRRVAAKLGMGTMSLYHYVHGRDEVVALMRDRFLAEYHVPDDELTSDWRSSISAIARATLSTLRRHPWALDVLGSPALGPNGLRHVAQSMRAVAPTGASPAECVEILLLVDDYTIGFAQREVKRRTAAGPYSAANEWHDLLVQLRHQMAAGPYLELHAGWGDDAVAQGSALAALVDDGASDERFERGLKRLLNGVAQDLAAPEKS